MKRLIKKNTIQTREFIIPTTPIYNPLGKGDPNGEFKNIDDKSYQKIMNEEHEKKYWKNK